MNTVEIVKDAMKYPLSNWRELLILGIIILIGNTVGSLWLLGVINTAILILLICTGFLIGFLVNGYMLRIVTSSLNNSTLPKFNKWLNMAYDGVKVFAVFIIYSIPLVLLFLSLLSEFFFTILWNMGLIPAEFLVNYLTPAIWPEILNLITIFSSIMAQELVIISIIYLIIIIPIFLIAIANMAYYEGDIRSAFRFRDIFEEISLIGWINLIKWYIMTGIIFLAIFALENVIAYSFSLIYFNGVEYVILWDLLSLTLVPYSYIFVARSVGLLYKPDEENI